MNNIINMNRHQPVAYEIVENAPRVNDNPKPRGMLLHCGAQVVDRQDLFEVATPHGTDTWYPLPHRSLVTEVEHQLQAAGFQLRGETHALTHDGSRYFGVIQVNLPTRSARDFGWVVGLRNSHDKSLPAGLVAGTQVFVCDNLAFNGEVKLSRKHTRFAMRDLKQLTARAVGKLGDKFADFDRRISAYKKMYLPDRSAHDLIVRSVDCRAITASQVPAVLEEWRKPSHEEFLPRNAWSLFNAFTEVYKGVNPQTAVKRGQALHGLFDGQVGLAS
ncbi:hypothetical protein NT6N_04410 [Oceaniferula spumae]|uniref:DUF932 domain-containing protein n=1 Tax=Oceaniferula spumae TaxID=2979115 RepID=A0AAT9FHE3_9BACT